MIPTLRKVNSRFLSSIIACKGDKYFDQYSMNLQSEVKFAYEQLCKDLECKSIDESHPLSGVLPNKHKHILNGTTYATKVQTTLIKQGRNRTIMAVLNEKERKELRTKVDESKLSIPGKIYFLTLTGGSSSLYRTFSADKSNQYYQQPASHIKSFVAWFMAFPLCTNLFSVLREGTNTRQVICGRTGKVFDKYGTHASGYKCC